MQSEKAPGLNAADDWLRTIQSRFTLLAEAARQLHEHGFIVVAEAVTSAQLPQLAAAYDEVIASADPADIAIGSTTTRVGDFVNRGPAFDELYLQALILAACSSVINRPFKLSTMHARTLHPRAPAQELHLDFQRQADGWPMVGFIFMVDEFREDNGATRFVPGSHLWPPDPGNLMQKQTLTDAMQVAACGAAGSVVIYNGSVWHGHGTNRTSQPRRSLQGAYIRRDAQAASKLPARMRPETLERISPLARYLLAL